MTEAFRESAERHWRDAELLQNEGRRANANQLFGFAAECAIKTALCQLPGCAQDGELGKYYRAHINELWDKVHLQGIQKRFSALIAILRHGNQFHDWSIDHRYSPEGTVSEEASERHRKFAKRLLGSVGINGARAGSR
jgi:HEPN domain-containing protein